MVKVGKTLSRSQLLNSAKQLLHEAMQDSGHLISTVAAIGGCLAT